MSLHNQWSLSWILTYYWNHITVFVKDEFRVGINVWDLLVPCHKHLLLGYHLSRTRNNGHPYSHHLLSRDSMHLFRMNTSLKHLAIIRFVSSYPYSLMLPLYLVDLSSISTCAHGLPHVFVILRRSITLLCLDSSSKTHLIIFQIYLQKMS